MAPSSFLACLTFAVFFGPFSSPALASLILREVEGSAEVSRNGVVVQSQSFGPFGGVAVAELGRSRAVQTGSGINAINAEFRLDEVRSFEIHAATNIEQTVQNTGNFVEDLSFHFLINGGELRLFSRSEDFDFLRATVGVRIEAFGRHSGPIGTVWWWSASLAGAFRQVTSSSELLVDDFGIGAPATSAIRIENGEASVGIGAFPAVLDLGTLYFDDATTSVTYHMSASVRGPGLNAQGGRARLGDPFDITGQPGSVISIPNASPVSDVPEPGSWALIFISLPVLYVTRNVTCIRRGAVR